MEKGCWVHGEGLLGTRRRVAGYIHGEGLLGTWRRLARYMEKKGC